MKKSYSLITALLLILFSQQLVLSQQSVTVQNIINQVNIDTLCHFVKELSGNIPTTIGGQPYTIVSRHKNQPGNDKAMQYIQEKLQSYGLTTTIQTFSTTGKNVYAVQPGTEFPNRKYMICAHFDDMPSGTTAPGADDNGSGTAAVLEAARIFRNFSFPFTIVYALWDEEEQGLIGSDYYATQAASAGDSILGVLNMDMIAYDGNNDGKFEIHTRSVGSSIQLKDKLLDVNTNYGIGVVPIIKNPGSEYSDHASFWDKGYGAVLIIEDNDDFHPAYHTVGDLFSTFNIPYFHKLSKLTIGALATLALNLNMEIEHTPIVSTNQVTPITITANVLTGLAIASGSSAPRLYYRTNQGSGYSQFYEVVGTSQKSSVYNFIIPGQNLGTVVQYYIAAQDVDGNLVATSPVGGSGTNPPGSTPPPTFHQFYVANSTFAFYDEATNINNWTATGTWGITTSKYVSAPSSFTDSPGGNYTTNVNSTFTLNTSIDLSNTLGAMLEFETQWDIEADYDYGQVQISTNNGTTWTALTGLYTNPGTGSYQPTGEPLYDGMQSTWVKEMIDLSNYINKQVKLRFLFRSDNYIQKDGWYIDNVSLRTYSIVPVELTTFTAEANENGVKLLWTTASELNNLGFEIQRSADLSNWDRIGFINGHGTSTALNSYLFFDNTPINSLAYYRIKQVDLDGTFKIYDPVAVDFTSVLSYELVQNYPNPFNPSTTISFTVKEKGFVSLAVYDALGHKVASLVEEEMPAGKHNINFEAKTLTSGVYYYRIIAGSFVETKKMMLIR